MQEYFGIKELYDVSLKTTMPMKIGNRTFETGEPILYFDKVQIAAIQENAERTAATGGKSNRNLIIWEDIEEVLFSLKEGVMSKMGLALLSNAKVIDKNGEQEEIVVPKREQKLTDKNGTFELKFEPLKSQPIFLYNDSGDEMEKITDYEINGKTIIISNMPLKDIVVDYYFLHKTKATVYNIGERLFNGFLKLEGKIYFKDDIDGINRTSLFEMPRVRIVSNFNITLGEKANPVVSTFNVVGFPGKGKEKNLICKMSLLDADVDAEI